LVEGARGFQIQQKPHKSIDTPNPWAVAARSSAVAVFIGGGRVHRRWPRSSVAAFIGMAVFIHGGAHRRWPRSSAAAAFIGGGRVHRRWPRSSAVAAFIGGRVH